MKVATGIAGVLGMGIGGALAALPGSIGAAVSKGSTARQTAVGVGVGAGVGATFGLIALGLGALAESENEVGALGCPGGCVDMPAGLGAARIPF